MRRGTRVGQAYVAVTADGDGINEEIVEGFDKAGPGVDRAGDEHGERYGDHFSEGFFDRMKNKFRQRLAQRLAPDMDRAGSDSGKHFTRSFADGLDNNMLERIADRIGANVGGHMVDALNHALTTEGHDGNALRDLFERQLDDAVSGNGRGDARRGKTIGDRIGAIFGAGSRNNFFNLFGKSMGGIVNLVEMATAGAGKMFSTFSKGFSEAEEGASFLSKSLSGFASLGGSGGGFFASIAASGPGAAVAILAVVAAMSIMVSVVGALIALVTALASTIASALVGALAVAAPAMLAVVAAGGLLTAAFMSMTDAQQAILKDAFLPIKKEMVGIAQIMLQDMVPAFAVWSKNLQQALVLLAPVARVMGTAFAQAGTIFTAALSGPGFQMFSHALAVFLPSIITRLSAALGSFLNGMLGLFSAIMPLVNQFAGYLAQVADRFSRWANSAAGQNAIVDFVDRAVASLQSLWNFVTSFSGFLAKVLFSPEAQNAGNSIFDSLAKTFDSFTQKVAQAQNNGSLKRWFDDAIKFGGQLWSVIEALAGTFMALYNSGTLQAVGDLFASLASVIKVMNKLLGPLIDLLGPAMVHAMQSVISPITGVINVLKGLANIIEDIARAVGLATDKIKVGTAVASTKGVHDLLGQTVNPNLSGFLNDNTHSQSSAGLLGASGFADQVNSLISSGNTALNNTSTSSGGFKAPATKKKWKNPYIAFANSLIKDGPKVSAQIKNAVLSVNKAASAGILSAARASSGADVQSSLDSMLSSITTTGEQTVNTAQSALNSAASTLANASSKKAAKKALKEVKSAQKDLSAALANQQRIQNAANIIAGQKVINEGNVQALLQGFTNVNATLADYAEARARVADLLSDANQKLSAAIALRDQYSQQVAESIKSFGSLVSAQAQTIDGVEQALNANDITSNLTDRLEKIKKFQNDLRLLLAQGLSNDAYKQIVDAGVDVGSTFAEALIAGGTGSIQQTNSLVSQINGIADSLGSETSSRLYQAGVDAAQGLVDGLNSLSAQLDAAAYNLGLSIAQAVKSALGIASPSKVALSLMDNFGDSTVTGLGNQEVKVGSAAARLAGLIAVSPGGGTYSSSDGVSGNRERDINIDLDIITPTEDPKAVANEAINELVGRL